MDAGLLELVEKILWAVSFIAIGGVVALMFFLVFAQSILGSKTIHSHLSVYYRSITVAALFITSYLVMPFDSAQGKLRSVVGRVVV